MLTEKQVLALRRIFLNAWHQESHRDQSQFELRTRGAVHALEMVLEMDKSGIPTVTEADVAARTLLLEDAKDEAERPVLVEFIEQ